MTSIFSLVPQLLLLSGTTAILLWHWLKGNRPEASDGWGASSERRSVLASVVSLFLELLLIRWISSELRIFAYLKSFVLIACFLGFGFGAYLSRRHVQMLTSVLGCLALAGSAWLARRQPASLFVWISEVMGEFEDVTMMGKTLWLRGADHVLSLALSCVAVASAFLLVTLVFIPFGQIVGRYLDAETNTIRAYSLNIAASLLGIWAFTVLALSSTPPWSWFLIGLLLCLGLIGTGKRIAGITIAASILTAVLLKDEEGVGSRASVFVAGNAGRIRRSLDADQELARFVEANRIVYPPDPVTMATDDWPFLYHQGRYIPRIYLFFSLLLAATAIVFTRGFLGGEMVGRWHFLFLGAAFLLLEVQIVSRLALFFGTTWIVNSIVISAVLIMILLSNFVAEQWSRPSYALFYTLLLLSIVLIYMIPVDRLFLKSELAKGIAVGGLFCLPVFFAGLIFITSFRVTPHKDAAFGANLLGAILGGFLEGVSFITGMRFLLLLAAGLYVLSAAALSPRLKVSLGSHSVSP